MQERYGIHPSRQLVKLFTAKPYQGADPADARILILGNDANYSSKISEHPFFRRILEYHADGVRFWTGTGFHHPFLLPEYPFDRRRGGVRYHTKFSKLGFSPANAPDISFVELLNVPTTGNTGSDRDQFFSLLNAEHLAWLEDTILSGTPKFVLVNQTLVRSIQSITRKHQSLQRLALLLSNGAAPGMAYNHQGLSIYSGYSFSSSITNDYLRNLSAMMRPFLRVLSA